MIFNIKKDITIKKKRYNYKKKLYISTLYINLRL